MSNPSSSAFSSFSSIGSLTDQRYDQYSSQLFDLIDEIERFKILDHILTIPSVVAAGDQTSGKSSVLGKLSGVNLPVGEGTVTLCATQLALRKASRQACRMEYPRVKEIANIGEIADEISSTQSFLTEGTSGFNYTEMPRIRIESEKARNLTVIDLPGIIHAVRANQDESVIVEVEQMVLRHITPEKVIILCVIDVTREWELNKVLRLVRDVDPLGSRTIVVFTKVDKLQNEKPKIRAIMDEVRRQEFHTFKHFIFVNSLKDSDDEEFLFFEALARDTGIPLDNCTFKNLYNKVCYMLLKPVMEDFRASWNTIDEFRNRIIEEKNKLPMFTTDVARVVDRKLTEFIESSRQNLRGGFSDKSLGRDLFSMYRHSFDKFKRDYSAEMEERTNHPNADVSRVGNQWRRLEPQNFHNWENFKCYAMPIVTSFQSPAAHCRISIRDTNKEFINSLIWEIFQGQKAHIDFLEDKISEIFDSQDEILADRLEQLYENEKYFYTDDELYEKLLDKYLEDERSPQVQRSWKILQSFIRNNEQFAAAMGLFQAAPNPDAADPAAAEAEVHYTEEELASVLGNLGKTFRGDQDSKHSERKKLTYETALKIFKEIAMDRISNTVPSTILVCMNDEVQKKMQQIDRHIDEVKSLEWRKSREEMRREELDAQEKLIQKWRKQFLKIETEVGLI